MVVVRAVVNDAPPSFSVAGALALLPNTLFFQQKETTVYALRRCLVGVLAATTMLFGLEGGRGGYFNLRVCAGSFYCCGR